MPAIGVSGYALTLGGFNTVNGVDVFSELTQTTTVSEVTLGGIDGSGGGSGLDVMAIVDTKVTVGMEGTGPDSDQTTTAESGIADSVLYGINLANANMAWIENTTVTATMTGTGGNGGAASGGIRAGGGGRGIGAFVNLYGIDLEGALDVSLTGNTVNATMTGIGGDGGDGSSGTGGGFGGGGGSGVDRATFYGIDLDDASAATLSDTTVDAAMMGNGGTGISGEVFNWINPDPLPPGVTLIDPTTFLGSLPVSNDGANGGP